MNSEGYIAYIDDDADDRELLADVFSAISNYPFLTFPDGTTFLKYLDELAEVVMPSLIILDINMPVMKGTDILATLKSSESYKDIPVVMFSTIATPQEKDICDFYNTDIVLKPNKFEDAVGMAGTLMSYRRK